MLTIESAIVCLNHAENAKFLKEQALHFQIDTQSNLKDYLDAICSNPTKWYQNAPEGIRSKSRFHKYKAPVCALLEHKDVINAFGSNYCASLLKNIKQTFKKCVDKVIDERKKKPANTDIGDADSTDDECSELDIDTLEVLEPTCNDHENNKQEPPTNIVDNKHDDLLVEYKKLKEHHANLQKDHQQLQIEHACVKALLARADIELVRVWESHNYLKSTYNTKS
jgi:hypothetical protein